MRLDRRTFLAGAAGFVGCSSVRPWRAMAASPHRFRHGSFNITVLSDGHFMLPAEVVAPDAMPAEWVDIEKRLGGSSGAIDAKCNVPLIRTEKDLILFDLGTDDRQGPAEPGHPGFHQRVRLPARPSSLTLHGVGEHDAQCATINLSRRGFCLCCLASAIFAEAGGWLAPRQFIMNPAFFTRLAYAGV
ncbi:hypothetical protein [Mesorhizobium sp.]|uniref:hypothetical protein n=1 Tax=Mesorhizobium sp. TaxID=1871066 RepID=UPI001200BA61|nr:hypothetical protein [Mesorhizobium sp.]TIN07710.1 MAG: hypothetical protein E5Y14_23755 [Mesorhizobium sp.]